MLISLLQLNMNADNYWGTLVKFLTSEDFDVITLQEVTGKDTVSGNFSSQRDCFTDLMLVLGARYDGQLAIGDRYTSNPKTSYMGNATFYKKDFQLVEKNRVTLHELKKPFPSDIRTYEGHGRNILHLTLQKNGIKFSVLNTHFAWAKTPKEEPHQTEQGKLLTEYLKKVPAPYLFAGDFNLSPDQPTIHSINSIATNLTSKFGIANTLNPREHRAKDLFPPGVAIDYIFISKDIQAKNFQVLSELDLSDHFGLTATIEL